MITLRAPATTVSLTLGSFLTNLSAQALPRGLVLQFQAGYQESTYLYFLPPFLNAQSIAMMCM